ncbi:helix-turn-helix domain-containing protein [Brucella anthropi]|uniref:helix-turn-helix domain-containing protein n=1 Tax=Brucella anthropi TaxID=529 RepID=UPI00216533B7|nr:helix-turn-helix domain-containing protein [Brucella anthropi]UVV67863.1 helix-turn-helix domain-containing protein [Brucella anthropi]
MEIDFRTYLSERAIPCPEFMSQTVTTEAASKEASIRYTIENEENCLRLVIDHSHFTAKQTEFRLFGKDRHDVATRIVEAAHEAVIALQATTFRTLGTVNSAVINSLDQNKIVNNVLREVMHLLPHCDAGVFRLFNEKTGFLEPVSHTGLPEDYRYYRLEPKESVSGEVYATGQSVIHNGRQNIIDAHRVMRPESQSFMDRSQIANALLCVPVVAEGKCFGTLTALCASEEGAFSRYDCTVLEFVAVQIAIAYHRSRAYREAVAMTETLEDARKELANKNIELDRAVELHETLLRIFSTAESLVDQLDAVEDEFQIYFRFDSVLGQSYRSVQWMDSDDDYYQPVEIAGTTIGQFHFSKNADLSFSRALFGIIAAFVAVDFVRDMSRLDVLNAGKRSHFHALLAGTDLESRRSHHGFSPSRFSQILVMEGPDCETSEEMPLGIYKTESDLQKSMTATNTLIFHDAGQIIALVSGATVASLERNLGTLEKTELVARNFVGISNVFTDNRGYAAALDAAMRAAKTLRRRQRSGVLRDRDLGVELLMEGCSRQDVLRFVSQTLAPLIDDEKHSVLYDTLSIYIAKGKSVSQSAEILGIHANTLYQRLQRMEALTGRKITDPADFTLLSLACQLHREYSVFSA